MAPANGRSLGTVSIRCAGRSKHFEVEPGATGVARVLCRDCKRRHPKRAEVLHRFDLATGELIETRFYRDVTELFEQQRRERDEARASVGSD